jgi:hypothetical protein
MFKATGIQIAIAAALLISMSPPVFADQAGCANESSGCSRGEEREKNAKPDFSGAPEGEEPEGEEQEG